MVRSRVHKGAVMRFGQIPGQNNFRSQRIKVGLRPSLMGAFGILFCNNFKRVFIFLFFIMVNGRKTHSCVEEKIEEAFKIIAK